MLRKINLNEKKNHVPELGLEPTTSQITQNQAKLKPKCYNHWATKGSWYKRG